MKEMEVEKTLARLVATYGPGTSDGLYPTAAQWRSLLERPYDGVLCTAQFAKFHPEFLTKQEIVEANEAYGAVTEKLRPKLGFDILYEGVFGGVLFGEAEKVPWDFIGMLKFPSLEAFLGLWLDPDYVKVAHIQKPLALERYKLIVTYPPFTYPAPWVDG